MGNGGTRGRGNPPPQLGITMTGPRDALTRTGPLRRDPIPTTDLLKTGSTVLDLAISGRRQGGFAKGRYFWMVGDSSSGKTFLMLTCLAEAANNPHFDNYRFIFDDAEGGALMDMGRYFGQRMAARLEPPATDDDGNPVYSTTIEGFYFNLDDALNGKKPFIYVLDSMDALDSDYAGKKFREAKTAARKGTRARGEYGDGKAKINSTTIRRVVGQLRDSGSILIVLSQTRDDIGAGIFEEQKTHAGGHALKFYATVQLWSSVGSRIKKTVREREVTVGVHCRVRTAKNRLTGRERVVTVPIYYDTGIDDIGSMVDFLTHWGFWGKTKSGLIDASSDFDGIKKRREDLILWLEANDLRDDLEDIVETAWADNEARLAIRRQSKYK